MKNIYPIFFITIGGLGIILAIRAFFVWELPFIGRNDDLYIIARNGDELLFWLVELFYFAGGFISLIFGARELRDEL